jgi:hypothetical protein
LTKAEERCEKAKEERTKEAELEEARTKTPMEEIEKIHTDTSTQ